MPDDVQYVCKSCHYEENPNWLDSVRQEIQAGYVYVCSVFPSLFVKFESGLKILFTSCTILRKLPTMLAYQRRHSKPIFWALLNIHTTQYLNRFL